MSEFDWQNVDSLLSDLRHIGFHHMTRAIDDGSGHHPHVKQRLSAFRNEIKELIDITWKEAQHVRQSQAVHQEYLACFERNKAGECGPETRGDLPFCADCPQQWLYKRAVAIGAP